MKLNKHHSLADVFHRTSCRLAREVFTYAAITTRKLFVQKYPHPSIAWFSFIPQTDRQGAVNSPSSNQHIFRTKESLVCRSDVTKTMPPRYIPTYGFLGGKGPPHEIVHTNRIK